MCAVHVKLLINNNSFLRNSYFFLGNGDMAYGFIGIRGTPTQRQTLAAGIIDLDGLSSTATITYQWQISWDNGATWFDIVGATSSAFVLGQAQVGGLVRATATYTDSQGNIESVSSAATTAVANVNDVGVATVTGAPVQGQSLTAGTNDVDGSPTGTVTYRWQQLIGTTWNNISGATASSYTLQAAQVGRQVRVLVSYTDPFGGGESSRASAATPAVVSTNPAGNDLGVATVAGTATQYQTLAASVTDIDGIAAGASIAYRWQQGGGATWSDIAGATSRSLVLGQAQVGLQVRVIATYTDAAGNNEQATSAASNVVANVNDVGIVTVFGAPVRGQTLTARVTDVDGYNSAALNIRWQQSTNGSSWSQFATGETVTLQAAQVGRMIRAIVSYTDQRGTSESNRTSAATAVVTNPGNNPGTLGITGTPTQFQALSASVSDADGVPASIGYQWQQSANGTTWTNIAGATASTLSLTQSQVGSFVRATATYTDSLGNVENPVASATAAVANVNDLGAVAISGIAAQNQTLTASVTDADGAPAPASITFQWQSSDDGTNWTNVATGPSLTLDAGLVGKQVRVSAAYADLLGGNENVVSAVTPPVAPITAATVSVFTNQTPAVPNFTDGPTVDYEFGMRFVSATSGQIQAIRYYKAESETGAHTGRIWSATGQILASVTFTGETASGWQQQALSSPLAIAAGDTYVVSVNANHHYAYTSNDFASSFVNGPLTAPVSAGVYNYSPGVFPSEVYQNENYFRDIVFSATPSVALTSNATIYVGEAAGTVTISVTRSIGVGQTTIEYTVNEIGDAATAQAGLDFTQPTFNGRANTGQVTFENGELTKTFTIPIIDDQLLEGNEAFSVGLQNPSAGATLGAPRTMLVTLIDNDGAPVISVSEPALTISEGAASATITIQRSGSLSAPATVQFATSNGTATAGSDYQATSGTVSFAIGQAVQTITIPLIGDGIAENSETFTVTLSNPSGATLGSHSTATVTILDNDLALGNLVRQTVVTGLVQPTAIEWTPDGRYMLVAQKDGVVRLVDNGTLRATPVVNISSTVNFTNGDRGLLGLAIHPNFASTPYIYLLHTYDPPETAGGSGMAGPDGGGNRPSRLVRLTVDPVTMVADPASLTVLVGKNSTWAYTSRPDLDSTGNVNIVPSGIVNGTTITAPADQIDVGAQDNDPNQAGIQNQNIRDYLATDSSSHTIGAVHFGPDGYLYLTNGDGTSYNFVDPRAVRVQDIDNLSGKLLRVDPITGAGVPGNPFYEPGDPNSNQSKVFYSGLRNAYRFTFDPVTGLPVVGDVGWTQWEEINTGPAGSNFGWPYLEGTGQTGGYNALSQAIAFYNNGNRNSSGDAPAVLPLLSRSHGAPDSATAITAGDFYTDNLMFFDDVLNGTIYAATFDASRQITGIQVVDTNVPYIVDLQKGPDGWIYGADLGAGTIRRWADPAATGSGSLAAP